ncbi:MAG: NAD(P)H-binding protein [Anaerolineales bacterium]|nr:NAD(P)H-binding protein [Anaerolineales bacterium]
MILVTGGTGFIGKVLVRQLVEAGHAVRVLIRPSRRSPDIPTGTPVQVTLSGLGDERGLRSAMVGVHTVFHLASVERQGVYANLRQVDVEGSRAVAEAARDAGVERLFYLSHLGADRHSAYPVQRAKAEAEEYIRQSGLDYTILRTSVVYGAEDGFTTGLARLLVALPFVFLLPGDGQVMLQPLWVEDLATCLTWALEEEGTRNLLLEVGGPEHLSLLQVVELIMEATGVRRRLVLIRPPYLRWMTMFLEGFLPSPPVTAYWLDYLAANRTCSLDTIPRLFSLIPARMSHRLDYLKGVNWRLALIRSILRRR